MNKEEKHRLAKKLEITWEPGQVERKIIELDIDVNVHQMIPPDTEYGLAFHGFHRKGQIGMVIIFIGGDPVNGAVKGQLVRHVLTLPEEEGDAAKDYLEGLMQFLVHRAQTKIGPRTMRKIEGYVDMDNYTNN